MARRAILTAAQRAALLALPTERRDLARVWTLSEPELTFLARRRRDRNRLGVALQLCALRYPGRLLRPAEAVPPAAVAFVAEQLGVAAGALGGYAVREPTKYEHSSILQRAFGFRPFEGIARREVEPSSGGSSRRPRPAARRPRTSSRSWRPSRGRAGSPQGCARSATSSARSSSSTGCAAPSSAAACRTA